MIQVDPDSPNHSYISITDSRKKLKTAHETVHGLTPTEAAEIIRKALLEERLRRASLEAS